MASAMDLKAYMSLETSKYKLELEKAKQATQTASQSMSSAFNMASVAIAAMASAVGAAVVKMADMGRELDLGLAKISTLVDITAGDLDKLGLKAMELGQRTGQATDTMLRGIYDIVGSNFELKDSIGILEVASKAAAAGATKTETATDALTSILNAYGDQLGKDLTITERAQKASDIFFETMKYGKINMEQLAGGIGTIAPIAADLQIPLEEVGAALAVMTSAGISTEYAITYLKGALSDTQKQTKEAADFAKELGLDFSVAGIRAQGLVGFLEKVKKAAGDDSEAMGKLFGDIRSSTAVMSLTGLGAEKFDEFSKKIYDAAGATERAFTKIDETADQKIKKATQTVKNIATVVGHDIVIAFADAMDSTNKTGQGMMTLAGIAEYTKTTMTWLIKIWLQASAVTSEVIASILEYWQGFKLYMFGLWQWMRSTTLELIADVAETWFSLKSAIDSVGLFIREVWNGLMSWMAKGLVVFLRQVEDTLFGLGEYLPWATEAATKIVQLETSVTTKMNALQDDFLKKRSAFEKEAEASAKFVSDLRKSAREQSSLGVDSETEKQIKSLRKVAREQMSEADAMGKEQVKKAKQVAKTVAQAETEEKIKSEQKKDEITKAAKAKEREAAFQNEQKIRNYLKETTKYFEQEMGIRVDKFKTAIKEQESVLSGLEGKYKEINQAQMAQREGFDERVVGIVSANLSEEGKKTQAKGLASSFAIRAKDAAGRGDFEEQLRLLQKAQDIFGGLADKDESAFNDFLFLQGQITQAFENQKKQNEEAQNAAKQKIADLKGELEGLFIQAEKKLEIKVETREAKAKLKELGEGLEKVRLPLESEGLLTKKAATNAPTVIVNINEKVDKDTVRKVIVPELEKLQRQTISVGE